MPTYANINAAQKEIKPWYANKDGAQTLLLNLNGNVSGAQKTIYTSTHKWTQHTYSKTGEYRYAIYDYGELEAPMGSSSFPNNAYLSTSYNFDQSTGIYTLSSPITQISYDNYYNITVGDTIYGHNYADLSGYLMIINGSMSGDTMYGFGWVQTEYYPATDEYGSWHVIHAYQNQQQVKWVPTISYVESENINAYENYTGGLASEYWLRPYTDYVFVGNTNTHYRLLY